MLAITDSFKSSGTTTRESLADVDGRLHGHIRDDSSRMLSRDLAAAVVVWVTLSLSPHAVFGQDSEETGPGVSRSITVSGTFVDGSGQPVVEAAVYLRRFQWGFDLIDGRPQDILAETKTDETGRFDFGSVKLEPQESAPLAMFSIVSIAATHEIAWKTLDINEAVHDVKLTARTKRDVTVQVVDLAGEPIVGASLETSAFGNASDSGRGVTHDDDAIYLYGSRLPLHAPTGADGRATIRGLPGDADIAVAAWHRDFFPEQIALKRGENADLMIRLEPASSVSGRVVYDDSGEPVSGIEVHAHNRGTKSLGKTDSDGRFSGVSLRSGEIRVMVQQHDTPEGYVPAEVVVQAPEGQRVSDIVLRLRRGISVRGRVVSAESGQGVAGVRMMTFAGTKSDGQGSRIRPQTISTNEDGHFEVLALPGRFTLILSQAPAGYAVPGQRSIRDVELDHYWWEQFAREVEVPPNGAVDVPPILVDRGLTINGTVRDSSGDPVNGAAITVFNGRFPGREPNAVTDDDGRFRIDGLTIGTADLQVVDESGNRQMVHRVVLPDGVHRGPHSATASIVLQDSATIRGIVTVDEKPLIDAPVVLMRSVDFPNGRGISYAISHGTTNSKGEYVFDDVEPNASVQVQCRPENLNPRSSRSMELGSGQDVTVPTFAYVSLTESISGVVTDPRGEPVPGVAVSVEHRSTGDTYRARSSDKKPILTNSEGRFSITQLPKGRLDLFAYIANQPGRTINFPVRMTVSSGDDKIEVILDPKLIRKQPIRRLESK